MELAFQLIFSFGVFLLLLAAGMAVPFAIAVPGVLYLLMQHGLVAIKGICTELALQMPARITKLNRRLSVPGSVSVHYSPEGGGVSRREIGFDICKCLPQR